MDDNTTVRTVRSEEDIRMILTVNLFDGQENPLTEFGKGARAALLWVLGEPSAIALPDPAELRERLGWGTEGATR